ncbi:MAG: undecaprenyl/decaprenyl-phosphate alpha-N-acetylglucosaminyl 1-phosphate transferase [Candidatus Kerfeldbacteria bacterium]|nr:undecaprenyl/decaprenyl-phosphate alpha-N-acetylglucosaminyl 1-phosphate transferase [Candidatus Kerfeldbacteria bacterium]
MTGSQFLLFFLSAGLLSAVLTYAVKHFARARGVVDYPDQERKIHSRPIPLLGGWAIYLSFAVSVLGAAIFTPWLPAKDLSLEIMVALLASGFLIMLGGSIDDYKNLKPAWQLVAPVAAILLVMSTGVSVKVITNPVGGGAVDLSVFGYWPLGITFMWLLGMTYTTKLLDGLDGLASGIGVIGSLVIFALTRFTPFYQPSVGLLAIILAGSLLGFLVWNWHPARVFLGEGGSLFIGFTLGVLAIVSGSKIATAFLVMGVPALDVAWIILRRLFWEKKSLGTADRKHLHHRLLDVGLSHRQAVVFLYALTAVFGTSALFLGSRGKLMALGILVLVMALLAGLLVWVYKYKKN